MTEQRRWTNLKTSEVVKAFAAKGLQTSRFIINQVTEAKGFVRRKMSNVLTVKEVARPR